MKRRILSIIAGLMPGMKLRTRIFVFSSAVSMLSVMLLGCYAYSRSMAYNTSQLFQAVSANLNQAAFSIEAYLDSIEGQMGMFASDAQIQRILFGPEGKDLTEQYEDYLELRTVISTFEGFSSNVRIQLYLDRESGFMYDREQFIRMGEGEQAYLDEFLPAWPGTAQWRTTPHDEPRSGIPFVMLGAKRVVGLGETQRSQAVVVFRLSEAALKNRIMGLKYMEGLSVYLIDGRGDALTSLSVESVGQNILNPAVLGQTGGASGNMPVSWRDENVRMFYAALDPYPLYLVAFMPEKRFSDLSGFVLREMMLPVLAILAMIFLVSYAVARGITKRIEELIRHIDSVEAGGFTQMIPVSSGDEIGMLMTNFNRMTERIHTLINDVYRVEMEKKEARLNLLQAQINPHFLYNTLDIINWLAIRSDTRMIGEIVGNLSRYLRLSINDRRNYNAVEDEIRHLQSYCFIQKYRFEDRVFFSIAVDPAINACMTSPLILQPLVENAITHGMDKNSRRPIHIDVTGRLADAMIVIEVSDDGLGMDERRLRQVQYGIQNGTGQKNYGLYYVHKSIQLLFGERYGLNIMSSPADGTTCVIIFPAMAQPPRAEGDGAGANGR